MRIVFVFAFSVVCAAQSLLVPPRTTLAVPMLLALPAGAPAAACWRTERGDLWPVATLTGAAPGEVAPLRLVLAGLAEAADSASALAPCGPGDLASWDIAQVGAERELRFAGTPLLRTATAFDAQQHESSFKSFQHLIATDGTTLLTKGAGGKYSHHRGLFLGWNNVVIAGKARDFWHGKDGVSIRHQRFRGDLEAAGPACGRMAMENHWCLADGSPVIEEVRVLTAFRCGAARALDIRIGLRAMKESLQLRGDPHHAGLHVRAADEVAGHEESTSILVPPVAKSLGNDIHSGAGWCAASFTVGERRCTFLLLDHPDNHSKALSSRAYARIGFMPEPDLSVAAQTVLRWRLLVFDGAPPDAATCELHAAAFRAPPQLALR